MVIIDTHSHLGNCQVFDLEVGEEELLGAMDRHGVNASIVFPFPGATDIPATHDRVHRLAQAHPGRIFGLASVNPHLPLQEYAHEVRRCVRELGFVGIKLHTIGHAINPLSKDAQKVYETAQELDVPVVAHTGLGVPFALPSLFLRVAQSYPGVKFVLAHAGYGMFTAEALAVARVCPNVYLETSWCPAHMIGGLFKALEPGRLMWGSDVPVNVGVEMAKVEGLQPEAAHRAAYLGKAAVDLYRLEGVWEG